MDRLRGVVVEPNFFYREGGSIQELLGWGVNCVRLHIIDGHFTAEAGAYAALDILRDALTADPEEQIKFIINLRYRDAEWDYPRYTTFWRIWAPVFDYYTSVIAYDCCNEPRALPLGSTAEGDPLPWLRYMCTMRQDMQNLTDRILIFQSGYRGSDSGFELIEPFGDPKIWYACNIHSVQTFTHQGIGGYNYPKYWPDTSNPLERHDFWGIVGEKLRMIEWAAENSEETIYVPEFACSGKADLESANNWARDLIALIEDRGWHATAHSYPQRISPGSDPDPLFHMPLDKHLAWWAKNGEG